MSIDVNINSSLTSQEGCKSGPMGYKEMKEKGLSALERGKIYRKELEDFLIEKKGIKIVNGEWFALSNYKKAWKEYDIMVSRRNNPIIYGTNTKRKGDTGDSSQPSNQNQSTSEATRASDRRSEGGGNSFEELSF